MLYILITKAGVFNKNVRHLLCKIDKINLFFFRIIMLRPNFSLKVKMLVSAEINKTKL